MGTNHQERLMSEDHLPGANEELIQLREEYHALLTTMLLARGATHTEAADLLADLWGDCVPGGGEKQSLLERFSGRCPIKSWLITVATNRLFDLRRRQRLRGLGSDWTHEAAGDSTWAVETLTEPEMSRKEEALVGLLRESLEKAFSLCPAQVLLMLHLIHLHGLTQREVARMWGWHESKVSRCLSDAMERIERTTLQSINDADPWMELTWQDFLDLCETHQIGFF